MPQIERLFISHALKARKHLLDAIDETAKYEKAGDELDLADDALISILEQLDELLKKHGADPGIQANPALGEPVITVY